MQKLRDEKEIIKCWSEHEKPLVSINCITYNHEKYIEDAIRGFLIQETDFPFEILIHDDASTDSTASIIRKYEVKYPKLIKPIYQTENKYSKGIKISLNYQNNRTKGKYIAICEGDDYWIDSSKLQKQVNYMERHPECSMCVHAAYRVSSTGKMMKKHVVPSKEDRIFTVEEIIENDGGLFATNSYMYKAELGIDMPEFYKTAPVGDFPRTVFMALMGKIYYMAEFMSCYRVMVKNSWSYRMATDKNLKLTQLKKSIEMLDSIDLFTKHKYKGIIAERKRKKEFEMFKKIGMYKTVKDNYKEYYRSLKFHNKVRMIIRAHFPVIENLINKVLWSWRSFH